MHGGMDGGMPEMDERMNGWMDIWMVGRWLVGSMVGCTEVVITRWMYLFDGCIVQFSNREVWY